MASLKIRPVANDKFIGFNIRGDGYAANLRKRARLNRIVVPETPIALPELPTRTHPLHDSILKLHVANTKLEEFRRDVEGFVRSDLNSIRFDNEPGGTHKVIRLVVGRPPKPEWDVEIGELTVSLRSVLDIAVTKLSKRRPNRPRKPFFPIFKYRTSQRNIHTFAKQGARSIAHLRPAERAVIEGAQPFHAGNLRWRHPIWLLHELSNTDKHNSLTAASMSIGSTMFAFPAIPAYYTSGMEIKAGVPFEDGEILGRVGREVNVKPQHAVSIRFAMGCPGAGDEVLYTLARIEEQVRKIVTEFLNLHPPA